MASAAGIRLGKVFVEIGADPSKLFGALNKLNKRIGSIGSSMSAFGGKMTALGAGIAAPLGLAVRQFAAFDDAIRATAAVTGSLGPQGAASMAMLNDKARQLGATTSFTAIQVANLMTELGRAGFKPDEINTMTGAVLDLARATGTDATLSAGIMAATLRQFGLGAGDAARAADILTYAANSSFNTVEGLGESLKYAGPVAKNLGLSLEDTVGILGVLGNVGIQGSEAGTALRRLGVITAGSGEELQKLFGISNVDAAGNLKPLVDILDEINTATASMSVAERTEKMAKAFGLLGITSANVLAGSASSVRAFVAGMANIDGVANKSAKAMDAGLGGAFRIALSAIEGTALAIGDSLAPSLQKIVEGFTAAAGGVTKFISANQELVVSFAKGLAIFTGVGAAIAGVGLALMAFSAAMGVVLSPIVLIPAAIVAVLVAVTAFDGGLASLASTASTTFSGIYAAIADGDLAGAMDILWKGLYAAWLRGTESLMNAVDPWVSLMQNTFTYLSANVLIVWDAMLNKMAAGWDALESSVRKGWNFLNAAFQGAEATALNDVAIDNEMRQRQADREEAQAGRDRTGDADATVAEREQRNEDRRKKRRRETQAAEADVQQATAGKREQRVRNDQFSALLDNVQSASTMDALRQLYEEYDALSSNGRITSAQMDTLDAAFEDAQERITKGMVNSGGGSSRQNVQAGADAAGADAAASQSEVAGTFSSVGIGGMGFGSSIAEKQLATLNRIEENTRQGDDGLIGD
jgi:TP901 family phage tail tape measure protein